MRPMSHSRVDFRGPEKTGEGTSCVAKGASVDEAPGPSYAPPRRCGGGSAKNKATQILSDAVEAISPCMRRSFVDRQYSPSIGMDQSEWEIILDKLIRMGFIVKKEHVSEDDD
jgi:hypothetical protein